MAAYADGDMEAFHTLYQRHKGRVLGFLAARLADRSEAEDVFQAVFAKLHAARQRYRQEIPFLAWIYTIARNASIDHIRKKHSYIKYVTTSEETLEHCAEPEPDTSSIGDILEEISSLTEAQRQALELRFNKGLTFEEISVQMRTSADNARQVISRAVRQLRKLMGGREMQHEN
jgi:RNA polymerase sigma factor (sigma-70 family)